MKKDNYKEYIKYMKRYLPISESNRPEDEKKVDDLLYYMDYYYYKLTIKEIDKAADYSEWYMTQRKYRICA